jgi:hypothetical protein
MKLIDLLPLERRLRLWRLVGLLRQLAQLVL